MIIYVRGVNPIDMALYGGPSIIATVSDKFVLWLTSLNCGFARMKKVIVDNLFKVGFLIITFRLQ